MKVFDLLPLAILAAVATVLGLGAGPAIEVASRAAEQLLDPARYVTAVLGEVP